MLVLVRIVATGRSDYPIQINNVLSFPGIFRGALDVRARRVNMDSPNTARPSTTQYKPPINRPSTQVSTLWAKPARWKA